MNRVIRKILVPLPRLVRWYLSRRRSYRFRELTLDIFPGVFHPGFFFSTTLLLEFVETLPLQNSQVMDVGAGSGIIAVFASMRGASVTALDISEAAIQNIRHNATRNKATLTVIRSDLFENVPPRKFDWIFINPPYYPRKPLTDEEFAWNCGEHHDYFVHFFKGLPPFLSDQTQPIMVLSEVCDLSAIRAIAGDHGFYLEVILEKKVLVDGKNYLFRIKPIASSPHGGNTRSADT